MTFGEYVTGRREAAGLTREALTASLGWSSTYILHVEAGRRVPAYGEMDRLLRALGLSLDEWGEAMRLAGEARPKRARGRAA